MVQRVAVLQIWECESPSPLGCVRQHRWDPSWALKLLWSWTLIEGQRLRSQIPPYTTSALAWGSVIPAPCLLTPLDKWQWRKTQNKIINLGFFAYFPFSYTPPVQTSEQCKDLVVSSHPHPSGQSELIPGHLRHHQHRVNPHCSVTSVQTHSSNCIYTTAFPL